MRICITANLWKRPAVTEAAFKSWHAAAAESEHDVIIRAVMSPDDPYLSQLTEVCNRQDVKFTLHQNQPMGAKANARSRFCADWDWDYMMVMGSDDIVSPNFLSAYDYAFTLGLEGWGWSDCYFYEEANGRLHYWSGYGSERRACKAIGAGIMLSRDVLECCNWRLWDDEQSRNMDKHCTDTIEAAGFSVSHGPMRERGVMLVDVKDDVSVTPLAAFDQAKLESRIVPAWLSEVLP